MKQPHKSTLRALAPEFVPMLPQVETVAKAVDLAPLTNFQKWKSLPKNHRETRFKSTNLGKIMKPAIPKKQESVGTLEALLKRQAAGEIGLGVKIAQRHNDRAFSLLKEGNSKSSYNHTSDALKQLERDDNEPTATIELLLDRQSKGEKGLTLNIATLSNVLEAKFIREKRISEAEKYRKITQNQLKIDEAESSVQIAEMRKAIGLLEGSLPAPKPVVAPPSQPPLKMSYLEVLTRQQASTSFASQPTPSDAVVHIPKQAVRTTAVVELERGRIGSPNQDKTIETKSIF